MKYVLKNVNLLDGNIDADKKMPLKKNVSVYIENDRITKISEHDEEIPSDCKIIDLEGKYMCPGLINLHVHLPSSGKPPKANAKPVNYKKLFDLLNAVPFAMDIFMKLESNNAKKHLMSGVTTIRTVGGVLDHDSKIRDKINAGKTAGPRIVACNTAVSVPGGHFAGSLATEAKSPEEAAEHVVKIAGTKPDWIKIMVTGGVMDASEEGEPGVLRMPPETVKAACDTAHSLGYKVAAHIESTNGVRVALQNGVDSVEHGAIPDDEIIELFKNRNAVNICTISPALPYVKLPEEISHCGDLGRANGRIVVHGIIESAKQCLDNGIKVGIGNDAGCNFVTPYSFWREIHYFTRYLKVSPDFALHTATAVNAEILGLDNEIGTVEVGKIADFVVCDKNPLDSFENLSHPYMVIKSGKMIKHPKCGEKKNIKIPLDSLL